MMKLAFVVTFLVTVSRSANVSNQNLLEADRRPEETLDDIDLVNYVNNNQKLWRAEFNERFSSLNEVTRRNVLGVRDVHLPKEAFSRLSHTRFSNISVPDTFDSREWWKECKSIGAIRDQSSCGSCWAFGAAEAITDRICIASRGTIAPTISAEEILSCCETCGYGCSGGYPLKAWDYWVENGIVTGGDYGTNDTCQPYPFPSCHKHANYSVPSQCSHAPFATPKCSHECNENYPQDFKRDKHFGMISYGIEKDELAIRKELMRYGPIEVVFLVYTDFFHYRSGIYKHTAGLLAGGHAVKLIGWGKEHGTPYWLIVNSWGNYWGDKGFFKILRGTNECGIEGGGVAGLPRLQENMN